jgi:hypothetical protein
MAAQADAARELEAEIARVRADADARLNAELARVRADAEEARQRERGDLASQLNQDAEARKAAEESAARALESEVARVKADADASLLAELERLRKETTEARLAQEKTQQEVEWLREVAAEEARQSAEEAAARALEAEVARVKAEADAQLQAEVERVRLEAEQARRLAEQSQRDTEALRDAAAQEAQESAARALETAVEKLREEADARLESEVSRVRKEADAARRALEQAQREAAERREQEARELRAAAEEEAGRAIEAEAALVREAAEARLREETERARQEANARLEMEVAAIKAEAEQRRAAELEEVRSQMLRLRAASAEQARVAAEEAVAKEVARARAIAPVAPPAGNTQLALREWPADDFVADRHQMVPSIQVQRGFLEGKMWMVAAAAVVLVAGGAFAYFTWGGESKPAQAAVTAPAPAAVPEPVEEIPADGGAGELRVESVPDGARVVLDGREVGFTPLTLKDVPAGRHALILEGDSGTLRRTVRVQADERTVARYEITAGFLAVVSRIPVEIFDGTRKLGVSDGGHILLAPGQYTVKLVNAQFGYREDVEFTIRPGEVSTHTVMLPEGSLHITTEAGAEIFVEGELMGVAPLAAFRVAIGAREVLVRHPDLGERKQTVEVVQGQPVELSVIFKDAAPSPQKAPPRLAPLSMPPERRPLAR